MHIDLDRIKFGAVTARELADAFIPHRVAAQISPRVRFPQELDSEARPERMSERAAGRAYISTGRVVGTLLLLPIAAVAIAATVVLTAAAVLVTAAALAIGIGGALAGGVIGAVGWATRRHTSPRRGAVAGLAAASGIVGVPGILGIRGLSGYTGRTLEFGRRVAIATSQVVGMGVGRLTEVSIDAGDAVVMRTSNVMSRLQRSVEPVAEPVESADVEGPAPVITSAAPLVAVAVTTAVAPEAPAVEGTRRVAVPGRQRAIVARSVEVPGTPVATPLRRGAAVELE